MARATRQAGTASTILTSDAVQRRRVCAGRARQLGGAPGSVGQVIGQAQFGCTEDDTRHPGRRAHLNQLSVGRQDVLGGHLVVTHAILLYPTSRVSRRDRFLSECLHRVGQFFDANEWLAGTNGLNECRPEQQVPAINLRWKPLHFLGHFERLSHAMTIRRTCKSSRMCSPERLPVLSRHRCLQARRALRRQFGPQPSASARPPKTSRDSGQRPTS
jgi:hypothetical protein